jgi:hypothetical protein
MKKLKRGKTAKNFARELFLPLLPYKNFVHSITSDDGSESYEHKQISKTEVAKILPWVHIAISNAKRMLLDIFHDIKPEYQQDCLNEFCYKFNRRYFGEQRFDRLMIAAATYKNQFRYNIE